jgi:hypothetical protein
MRVQNSGPSRVKNFHISILSRPGLGPAEPPIQWVPEVKQQGHETDHSYPISAKEKKTWIYTSILPYVVMA